MKIPKTFKIGGHIYKVKFPYRFRERTDIIGQHDKALREFKLSDSDAAGNLRAKSEIILGLIHELLHSFDVLNAERIFDGEDRERRIEALAEAILAFLVDNGYLKIKEIQ